jgi:hypothetical protein
LSASPTCPPNGLASARCSDYRHSNRVSVDGGLRLPGNRISRARDRSAKSPLAPRVGGLRDRRVVQNAPSAGLCDHPREISENRELRGGAGRTRTSSQSVMSEPPAGREGEFFRPRLSTGLPAQEERACKIDRTAETSVSTPLCPALSGPEVVEGPIWARGPT